VVALGKARLSTVKFFVNARCRALALSNQSVISESSLSFSGPIAVLLRSLLFAYLKKGTDVGVGLLVFKILCA
jgi:hypothetical protein